MFHNIRIWSDLGKLSCEGSWSVWGVYMFLVVIFFLGKVTSGVWVKNGPPELLGEAKVISRIWRFIFRGHKHQEDTKTTKYGKTDFPKCSEKGIKNIRYQTPDQPHSRQYVTYMLKSTVGAHISINQEAQAHLGPSLTQHIPCEFLLRSQRAHLDIKFLNKSSAWNLFFFGIFFYFVGYLFWIFSVQVSRRWGVFEFLVTVFFVILWTQKPQKPGNLRSLRNFRNFRNPQDQGQGP